MTMDTSKTVVDPIALFVLLGVIAEARGGRPAKSRFNFSRSYTYLGPAGTDRYDASFNRADIRNSEDSKIRLVVVRSVYGESAEEHYEYTVKEILWIAQRACQPVASAPTGQAKPTKTKAGSAKTVESPVQAAAV